MENHNKHGLQSQIIIIIMDCNLKYKKHDVRVIRLMIFRCQDLTDKNDFLF